MTNYIPRRPRAERWRDIPDPQFKTNVADDLDDNERDHARLREERDELIKPILAAQENTNKLLIGLLVALSSASIVGALNLLLSGGT